LREIKGALDHLLTAEEVSVGNKEDYLRIVLTDEDEIIDPMNKLRRVYPNVMVLDFANSRTSVDLSSVNATVEKVEQLSEFDLFSQFFSEVSGGVMTEEQIKIISRLLDEEDAQ
jgi:exonuclease SbcD